MTSGGFCIDCGCTGALLVSLPAEPVAKNVSIDNLNTNKKTHIQNVHIFKESLLTLFSTTKYATKLKTEQLGH